MNREELAKLPVWNSMSTITLSDMNDVKLMNRIDTKYLTNVGLLPVILQKSLDNYKVQIINGSPISSYDTIYFDTDSLDMYNCHHNKILFRKKIRMREYLDSSISFFEIKHKNNRGRVKKRRIEIPLQDFEMENLNSDAITFVEGQTQYKGASLVPQVHTIFDRITLVNNQKTERLTIDLNLRFENSQTGNSVELPEIMIIELKQDGYKQSFMKELLRDLRVTPRSMSKYCLGTVLTNPNAKSNGFKKKLRFINKIKQP